MAYVGWEGTALSRRPKGIVGYTRSTEAHQQHKSIRSGRCELPRSETSADRHTVRGIGAPGSHGRSMSMAWARRERAKKRGEV